MTHMPTLDGWRGVAILCVIVSHSVYRAESAPNSVVGLILFHLGAQGVALFFAISGFLITTLLLRETEEGGIRLEAFYIRRVFRILPAAFAYLLTLVLLSRIGMIELKHGEILASALFANNYWPERSWLTAHFWSLSIEEHFYFIWPSVLAFLGRSRAVWFAIVVAIATAVWRFWGFKIDLNVHAIQRTDMRLDAFMYAGLCAIMLHEGKLLHLFNWKWLTLTSTVVLAIVYGAAIIWPDLRNLKEVAQAVVMPVIVVSTVQQPFNTIGRILEMSWLKWVGNISYSLYLWQELFLTDSFPGGMLVKVAVLFICAWLSYIMIENPFRRLARTFLHAPGAMAPTAS